MNAASLGELQDGLRLLALEGELRLDRPAPVRRLATATLRGLAGHALLAVSPDLVQRWFKPGHGNDRPPAYIFQPLHSEQQTSRSFPFRIVTWDPDGELAEGFMEAFARAGGMPFGSSGARLDGVALEPPAALHFEGADFDAVRVVLHTPLKLVHHRRIIGDQDLTPGHLIEGAVRRVNRLSQDYGNGLQLDAEVFLAQGAMMRELGRNLRWVAPRRQSCTQQDDINLGGVVGWFDLEGITSSLAGLLCATSALNLGRHTAEGCGHILLN